MYQFTYSGCGSLWCMHSFPLHVWCYVDTCGLSSSISLVSFLRFSSLFSFVAASGVYSTILIFIQLWCLFCCLCLEAEDTRNSNGPFCTIFRNWFDNAIVGFFQSNRIFIINVFFLMCTCTNIKAWLHHRIYHPRLLYVTFMLIVPSRLGE